MESPMMMMQPVLVNPHRRFSAISSGHSEMAVSGLALPPNVIRLPRGPDKGKGFQKWCKSRMAPPPAAAPAVPAAAAAAPVQRKSRAIPIVAPPEVASAELVKPAAAASAEPEGAAAAVALPAEENNNLVVNLAETSSDSDEGHFSDHDLEPENERTR